MLTCPTGIDIRDGLQMECIHCTQCADACDAIMAKIDRPLGLIRYTSRDEVEGKRTGVLRPRVVLYPLALALSVGLLAFNLGTKADTDVTLLRGAGAPFTRQPDGNIVEPDPGQDHQPHRARAALPPRTGRRARRRAHRAAESARRSPAPRPAETSVFVVVPESRFSDDRLPATVRVTDDGAFTLDTPFELVGPDIDRHQDDGAEAPHAEEPRQ